MQIQKPKQGYKIIHTKYSGFYEIPNDWNLKKLGEILRLEYGEGLVEDKRTNFGYPVYGSGGLIGNHNKFLTTGPGIVVSRKGSLGNVFFISDDFWAIDTVYYITKDQTTQDLHFLTYFLRYLHLENYAIVTAQPGISREEVYAIYVKVPSLPEQQKIASILSNVDSLIHQTQKTIEQTKRLKKGLIQKLLTKGIGHIKFKKVKWYYGKELKVPENWEVKTLGEFCKVRQGLQIPISDRFREPGTSRFQYITVKSIHSDNFEEYIENPSNRVICNEDDILFTRTGNTGEIITNVKGVFHNNFFLVDFNRKILLKEYLIIFLKQHRIQEIIISLAGSTTIPDLNHGDFFRLIIAVPPLKEQQKITTILSNVDSQIQKHQEHKTYLENLKKGLMQKLLTGQIRVKI